MAACTSLVIWEDCGRNPVARCPIADPAMRNDRTGLLGGRAASSTPVLGLLLVLIMQFLRFGATRESTAVTPRGVAAGPSRAGGGRAASHVRQS